MTVDAQPAALLAAAQAAADDLLDRAVPVLIERCATLVEAYAAADRALLRYESLAAARVVQSAYDRVRRGRRLGLRRGTDRVDTQVVDRRILVTRTMSEHVTAWFQLHAALTEVRAQAMHLVEAAGSQFTAPPTMAKAPLQDDRLAQAERIAQGHAPEGLRTRLKQADGSIKRQIVGRYGDDEDTQPIDADG